MWVWRTTRDAARSALTAGRRPGSRARGRGRRVAQREVARGDRRREPVVERLRDPQPRVDPRPTRSRSMRDLVGAQPARVEEAEQLDRAEVRLAQRAELLGAVLVDVPRVAGALGALGRERQDVRRRDVDDAARPATSAKCSRISPGFVHVLDRLEEDDRVARLAERVDRGALEAQVRAARSAGGVLVRLRVRVDSDDRAAPCAPAPRSRSPRRMPCRRRASRSTRAAIHS